MNEGLLQIILQQPLFSLAEFRRKAAK